MHLRAHGTVAKIFGCLQDAAADPVSLYLLVKAETKDKVMICITPDQVTCQFKGPEYQTQMTEINRTFFVIINSSFHL